MAKGTNRQAASKARAQMQAASTGKELRKSSGKKRGQEDLSDEEGPPRNERPAKKNPTDPAIVQNIDQSTQIQLLMKELQSLKRKNEEKEAVIDDLSSGRKKKRGKKCLKVKPFPVNDKAKEEVAAAVVEFLFRGCKFLSTDDQLKSACEDLMGDMPRFKSYLDDVNTKDDYIEAFYDAYGDVVCKTLNVARSNCQQGIKKAYEERYRKGLSMPTPRQLALVILRKGLEYDPNHPTKNAQNREWFRWYWEHLLPKCCSESRWGRSIRHYGIISAHAPANYPKTKYVTSSDEALVLLIYENCGQRFPYCAKCKVDNVTVDKSSELYQSRWTDSAVGQSKFGGWDLEGRARFREIREKVSHAKRKIRTEVVEKFILGEIQAFHKIGNRGKAKKGEKEVDFQREAERIGHYNVEDDDETVDTDGGFTSDLEELDDTYRKPRKKKSQGDQDDEEDEDETVGEGNENPGEEGANDGGNGGDDGESG